MGHDTLAQIETQDETKIEYFTCISDLHEKARAFMAEHKVEYEGEFYETGTHEQIKFEVDDEGKTKNAWLKCSYPQRNNGEVGLCITFQVFHPSFGGEQKTNTFWPNSKPLSDEERAVIQTQLLEGKKRADERAKEEQKQLDRTADWCQKRFYEAKEQGTSPYIDRKKVTPIDIRFETHKIYNGNEYEDENIVLIPIRNDKGQKGQIRALQEIYPTKRKFHPEDKKLRDKNTHGSYSGCFFTFGKLTNGEKIYICEGYATGNSIFLSTNQTTLMAVSRINLLNVGRVIKERYPDSEITFCADDEPDGKRDAENAARTLNSSPEYKGPKSKVCIPKFPQGKELDEDGKPNKDFNDLMRACGKDEVKKQINNSTISSSNVQVELKKLAYNLLDKEEPCSCFSLENMPKILNEYISSICETTNAHPIMITSSVLATISAFLQKSVFMPEGEYFQTLYPNLWLLNVTKSGQFKSTAMNKGAKLAWERSKVSMEEIKKIEAEIRRTTENNKKKELEEKKLVISLNDVVLPNKITTEALLEHLAQGHAGVIFTSEFGAWLQNLEKSHNNDLKAILTDLYDVPQSYRYKTKTQGDSILEKPFFSICGVSTLPWLKSNLKPDDVSSGFFARFLLFTPPYQDEIPPALPRRIITSSNINAENRVRETLKNMDKLYSYTLSPSARNEFESLHLSLYKMIKSYSDKCQEILEPYLKRWSPYILKLAMILRPFEDPFSNEISDTAINSAMAILLPAIKSTAQLFEGELGESDHERKCRIVFDWICKKVKKSGEPVKWKDLIMSKQLRGGSVEYEYVCKTLIESGRLIFKENPKKMDCLYAPNNQ